MSVQLDHPVYHLESWHLLNMVPGKLPLKFGQNWASNSWDIAQKKVKHQKLLTSKTICAWKKRFVKKMWDELGQLMPSEGLSGYYWATQGPVGPFQGPSEVVRTTSGQHEYVLVWFGTQFCFANISAPKKAQIWFCIQNLPMDLSFQKKNSSEICFLVFEIYKKQIFLPFF